MKFTRIIILLLLFPFLFSCHHREVKKEIPKKPAEEKKLTAMDTLLLDLENLKKDSALKHASLSYCISDYSAGKQVPVADYNADMSLVPASVMKVLTTGAALEILGEGRSFRTSLQYDGTIENRILKGNLYIRGGGDPTFGAPSTFDRWARTVRDLGIDSISGSVIGDSRVFSRFSIPATWTWGELLLPYCAPASGLTYSGNVFQGAGQKGKKGRYKPAPQDVQPEIPGLEVENDITDAEGAPAETYLQGNPVALKMSIQGTVEKGNPFFPYSGVVPDPALVAANDFTKKLVSLGIKVGGPAANLENADSAVLSTVQKERKEIAATFSPSVAALVTLTNIHSNNLFAEDLSKHVGLSIYKSGHSESGCRAVLNFWKSKGIDTEGMFLYDGCGVSRYDGVTSRQLADILYYMTQSPSFTTFYNSLPLAGVSGTLAKYMKGTRAEGNLRAKTGSISRVKSYAGYVRTVSGKRFIFAILVNNFTCSGPDMVRKLEKIMVDMAAVK
jgi:serine-type D-Ala-D-Ala carboxypeptidase/endopeptidase (penicillin-binding protein 4)